MKYLIILAGLATTFAACKQSKEELIARRWQAVALESPMMDEQIRMQREFLDTVGTSTDAATNEVLYGVRNMDSMRQWMKTQFDSIILEQKSAIANTWLNFSKEGTVVSSFGSAPDTVSWYFDDEGALILDELKHKGAGSKVKMEVVKLDEDSLKLRFNENGFSSTAILIPAKD